MRTGIPASSTYYVYPHSHLNQKGYFWRNNLVRAIEMAAILTLAYQQGEADAWIAADKHYAKEATYEYNEGYEAGRAVAAREYQSYNW